MISSCECRLECRSCHTDHYNMDCNLSSMPACVVNANEFSRNRIYFENHPRELGGLRMCMWRWRTRRNGGQWKPSLASSRLAPRSDKTCRAIPPMRSTRGMCSRVSAPGSLQAGGEKRAIHRLTSGLGNLRSLQTPNLLT